jgi:hypothetical protein
MERKALWLFGGILALAVPAFAQSGAGDTIAALLVEVRQLRIAMERSATTTPQVQLLGARLSVQNERLARVERDHDNAKRELDDLSAALVQTAMQADNLDNRAAVEANPERQRQMLQEQADAKAQVAELRERSCGCAHAKRSWRARSERSSNSGPSSIAASTRSSARSILRCSAE